nr:PAS domain S-box protein [uncultured Methanoregula sp.]
MQDHYRVIALYRILYVDDEISLLELGKLFLEASGDFTVVTALSAAEAIRLLEQEKFDAIVSDYQMPDMDGIQFLTEVRLRFGPVPFILFTGRGREEIVIQALNSGADFYLQKGGEPKAQYAELAHKVKAAALRKRAEDLLRMSEERYREFFTISRDSIFITTPDGRWIDFNDALMEMIGYTDRDEMSKLPVLSIYADPEDRPRFLALVERQGYVKEYPLRLKQRDGTVIDTLFTTVPVRNPDGSLKAFLGTIRDVTEMKRIAEDARRSHEELAASYEQITATEEELRQTLDNLTEQERIVRESEENYRTVFENTGTAMVVIEESRIISLANSEFTKLSGFSIDEVVGKKTWSEFVVKDDLDRMLAQHKLRRQNPEKALPHYEFRFITKSGDIRNIYLTISVIPGTKRSIASLLDITDRKRAEEILKDAQEYMEKLIQTANAMIVGIDSNGTITLFNKTAESITGYTSAELAGRNWFEVIVPLDRYPYVREEFNRLLSGGLPKHFENPILTKSGEERYIVWKNSEIRVKEQIVGTISYGIDITERKRAEEALAESRRELDAMAANIPGVVYRFCVRPDGSYGFDYISRRSRQILGLENDTATFFDRVTEGIVPENREKFLNSVQQAIRTKTPWMFETQYVKPSGQVIWVSAVSSPVMENEKLIFDGVIFDVTERKRTEQSLQDAALHWQSTFDSTLDAICLLDTDQRIITCNRTMQGILGAKNADALVGRHCWEAVHDTTGPIPGCPHHRMLESHKRETMELESGGRWFTVVADPIWDETGKLVGAVHSMRDITDQRRAEDALLRANRKLALLSSITRHDISNQLMTLDGFVELLHSKAPYPAFENYFTRIRNASSRISAMIRFTKEYAEIGVNAPVWQNCRVLIDTAAKEAPLGEIALKNEIPPGAEVFADPLIVKVCYNLIDNALRYGGKITTIRFFVLEHAGAHVVVCEDDGNGLPAEEKEKIFGRGYGKNTGLGLALSREILDITGITIKENGEPGRGARFEISVPEGMFRFLPTLNDV